MPDPVWPATRSKFCSRKCFRVADYARHKDELLAKQAEKRLTQPEKVRAIKRKYNVSDKGRLAQEQYRSTHDLSATYLAKYRSDPLVRQIQLSREQSRKKLLKHTPRVCSECGVSGGGRLIHCHHRDDNPLNRELWNLEWLCRTCHTNHHAESDLT